jgi:hypothetical protein
MTITLPVPIFIGMMAYWPLVVLFVFVVTRRPGAARRITATFACVLAGVVVVNGAIAGYSWYAGDLRIAALHGWIAHGVLVGSWLMVLPRIVQVIIDRTSPARSLLVPGAVLVCVLLISFTGYLVPWRSVKFTIGLIGVFCSLHTALLPPGLLAFLALWARDDWRLGRSLAEGTAS